MKILANIDFDGDCREAFTAYERIFGGTIRAMLSHRDMPETAPDTPEERKDRILHAWLDVDGSALMGQDNPDFSGRKGMSVTVVGSTAEESQRLFEGLSEGGKVMMPFGPQSWSKGFGFTQDRFDVAWVVDTEGQP